MTHGLSRYEVQMYHLDDFVCGLWGPYLISVYLFKLDYAPSSTDYDNKAQLVQYSKIYSVIHENL